MTEDEALFMEREQWIKDIVGHSEEEVREAVESGGGERLNWDGWRSNREDCQ